ncbi:hypothetical protein F5Y04DRAFT_116479 [Hypomontagnella monticulosa]|nr:hypothetical protein F5Y04DRAFT_116479 [Hypomontagnella monticulosa]
MNSQRSITPVKEAYAHNGSANEIMRQQLITRLTADQTCNSALEAIAESPENAKDIISTFKHQGFSWDDVLQSIHEATNEYNTRLGGNGIKNVHNNRILIKTLHSLTDMIPDQDGLSVMRGGLKLIFKLLQKRIDNREQIFRIFKDVPIIFAKACEAIITHPRDDILRGYVNNLFTTLVDVIPKLVEIMLRRRKGSLPGRLFKQHPEHEAIVISDCLDAVTRDSQKVTNQIDILVDRTVTETLEEARVINSRVQATQQGLWDIYSEINFIHTGQAEVQRMISSGEGKNAEGLDVLANIIDKKIENATSILKAELRTLQTSLSNSLRDNSGTRIETAGTYQELPDTTTSYSTYSPQRTMLYSNLFFSLGLPSLDFLVTDIEEVLRIGNDVKGIARAKWLLVTERFQSWVQNQGWRSDLVLVNGHLGDVTTGKVSALSVLAALFATTRRTPQVAVLYHFCGLHSRQGDPTSGPRGLLRSLLAQMVIYLDQNSYGSTASPIISNELLQDIARGDILASCLLFSDLVTQLGRSTTLYVVIDNVSEFETPLGGWDVELREVISFLQSMVNEQSSGPILKIMVIASNKSIQIHRQIPIHDQIWLNPDNLLSGSAQRLSFEHELQRAMVG